MKIPTVCDWLGIGVHPDMQGKSLLPMAFGEVEKVRDFAIAGYNKYSWAIYNDDWSYIHWLGKDESNMIASFYNEVAAETREHLKKGGGRVGATAMSDEAVDRNCTQDAATRHKEAASLDGEDQWTCTPGARADVPIKDELYDRKNDPFQLNNVIDQYPEEAKKMFDTLREFMTELSVLG